MRLLPDWMDGLPLQQQSVLLLALRGPDGIAKDHWCKNIWRAYRASVIRAAYLGRMMTGDDKGDSFMTLRWLADGEHWSGDVNGFFAAVDSIPHHAYMHLMHGAEILGYKHPDPVISSRWRGFYFRCCADLHVRAETVREMDGRLNDGDREHWTDGEPAWR